MTYDMEMLRQAWHEVAEAGHAIVAVLRGAHSACLVVAYGAVAPSSVIVEDR